MLKRKGVLSDQMAHVQPLYPFSALVGQETMKLALLLAVIDPAIGGVLLRGSKGAAKSTAVRALHGLLPELPLLTLPLNATEEMLLGGLDWQAAIQAGERRFRPGLLARANGGILYVDEVNLLDDHLVDVMLETLARGWHRVEREGIAAVHAAQVTLIGTMNPEEGELRPHLLDRFGLCVEVQAEADVDRRVLVLERREAFDRDPVAFQRQFQEEEGRLRARVLAARAHAGRIGLPARLRLFIAELCARHQVAGHRADLTMQRAAMALAALEDRLEVALADIERVAPLVLRHRQRDALPPTPAPPPLPPEITPVPLERPQSANTQPSGHAPPDRPGAPPDGEGGATSQPSGDQERVFEVGSGFAARRIEARRDRRIRRGSGRRSRTLTMRLGRYVRAIPAQNGRDIALDATIRVAAPEQSRRPRPPGMAIAIHPRDLRERRRERRIGNFILFVVDASGSMGARARMVAAKGAIMALLTDAYQKRDRVAMITFRRREATLILPPTASIELTARRLHNLPVGGRTPLAAGLAEAARVLHLHLAKEPAARPILVVITDGKANVALAPDADPRAEALQIAGHLALEPRLTSIVIDTESPGVVRFGLARHLAETLGAACYALDDLRDADLIDLIQSR